MKYIRLECWLKILVYLYENKNSSITDVSKRLDFTFSHTFKVIMELIKIGTVMKQKLGRRQVLKLTEEGIKLIDNSRELINFVCSIQED